MPLATSLRRSVRGLGSYIVPKVDVLVSAIFRSQANAQPGMVNVATNGARWMQPTAVLLPRFVRVNVQLDF